MCGFFVTLILHILITFNLDFLKEVFYINLKIKNKGKNMIANFKNIPLIVKFYHSEPVGAKNDPFSPDYRVCTCNIRVGKNAPSTFKSKIHMLNRNMPINKEDVIAIGGYVSYPTNEQYVKSEVREKAFLNAFEQLEKILNDINFECDFNDFGSFEDEVRNNVNLG